MNETKYKRWIDEGRGQGVGKDYKPWLTVRDVSSLGREHQIRGYKCQRTHHFLSDNERNYFFIAEYSDYIIDIREQYPLPLEETLLIAEELGINHPKDNKTKHAFVLTTDMLLTGKKGNKLKYFARTIKPKDDLLNPRQLEKFELERQFWERKGVDWGIVTEHQINKTLADNISMIYDYHNVEDLALFEDFSLERVERFVNELFEGLYKHTQPLIIRDITEKFDDRLGLISGSGISIYYHLLKTKAVFTDLSQEKINLDKPLSLMFNKVQLKEAVV
ncbi:TnsA endonuclease N-terminal domain-containing protein [Dehalobacter sp. DCM]|uniref:TnsA endonuclease N-terminal domain-containing protein n=1 Tax=Dehalobacter sp. DCM TaxID=2907827 RepID=UPI0030817F45|nr:TnsA endonuclease N-terminal domain-containing protein [Dehalobacter sp. DCM]